MHTEMGPVMLPSLITLFTVESTYGQPYLSSTRRVLSAHGSTSTRLREDNVPSVRDNLHGGIRAEGEGASMEEKRQDRTNIRAEMPTRADVTERPEAPIILLGIQSVSNCLHMIQTICLYAPQATEPTQASFHFSVIGSMRA